MSDEQTEEVRRDEIPYRNRINCDDEPLDTGTTEEDDTSIIDVETVDQEEEAGIIDVETVDEEDNSLIIDEPQQEEQTDDVSPEAESQTVMPSDNRSRAKKGRNKRVVEEDEDEEDDRLEDDDYDLLEENLGVKLKKRRFKRLRRMEDSDSEGSEADPRNQKAKPRRPESVMASDDEPEKSDSDSDDDFIVDDNDEPVSRRIRAMPEFCDENVKEAREIFGADFNYDDIPSTSGDEDSEHDDDSEHDESETESRVTRDRQPKAKAVHAANVFEPALLEKAGITDEAQKIFSTDLPERFQIRRFPVSPLGSEGNREAVWIYQQAFASRHKDQPKENVEDMDELPPPPPPAANDNEDWDDDLPESQPSGTQNTPKSQAPPPKYTMSSPATYVSKIKKIIKLIRAQKLEVPYIYFYQRDLTKPEFSLYDLWKIYSLDEEYCRMHAKQQRLVQLFVNMKAYQETLGEEYVDRNDVRKITDEDLEGIRCTESFVELEDMQSLFVMYYADDVPKMKALMEERRKETERLEMEQGLTVDDTFEEDQNSFRGRARSSGGAYRICKGSGIGRMLPLIGLTADEFGENFHVQFPTNYTHQTELSLDEVLTVFSTPRLKDKCVVMAAAKHMLATNISRDFRVRKIVRKMFLTKGRICVAPTRRGLVEIDENHPLFSMKFLKNKPVSEMDPVDFMELTQGEKSGLVKMKIGDFIPDRAGTGISLIDEAKQYFKAEAEDEELPFREEWDEFRGTIVEFAFENFLYPEFRKEVRFHLLKKASDIISQRCSDRVYSLLRDAPFSVKYDNDNDDQDWNTAYGIRVLALAYEWDVAVQGVLLDNKGHVLNSIIVTNMLTKHFKILDESNNQRKEGDKRKLKEFILENKPHVIVIGGESRDALNLRSEIYELLFSFPQDEINFNLVPVLIIDNEAAKVYARTTVANEEFPGTVEYFRQAVSLGRYIQDPLLEMCQLCNKDEDILCLNFNKHQSYISKEELLRAVEVEFINRACETGVDVNDSVKHSHRSQSLQFIAGFGFNKANGFLRQLRNAKRNIENRAQLLLDYNLGPVIYRNAGGFLRIKEYVPEDAVMDPRDQSRIHPQHYEFALTVARATLTEEDDAEKYTAVELLEKAMVDPVCQQNLLRLDLQEYVEGMKCNGGEDQTLLFESIVAEMLNPYFELRKPFNVPGPDELFYMLTKETFETVREAKLITAYVNDARWRKPSLEDFNNAVPLRDPFNKRVICPFCTQDFNVVEELWHHFDTDTCPGEIYAVHIRFGNDITGIIKLDKLADDPLTHKQILKLVSWHMPIEVRILRVDTTKFFLECTAKSSDLHNVDYMPEKDAYYDTEAEMERLRKPIPRRAPITGFMRRNVTHPSYKNISFIEAEQILKDMDQGDVIFRPSTKGFDILSLTWNVVPGILQHLNVLEKKKRSDYELGSKLEIGGMTFEDLDEIIVRYVNPQAALARDIIKFKYFNQDDFEDPEVASEYLKKEREKKENKTHYVVTASRTKPGTFILSFLPHDKVFQESLSLTPDGIWFRNHCFQSLEDCIDVWKKEFTMIIPAPPLSCAAAADTIKREKTTVEAAPTPALVSESLSEKENMAESLGEKENTPAQVAESISSCADAGTGNNIIDSVNMIADSSPPSAHVADSLSETENTPGSDVQTFPDFPSGLK